MTTRTPWSQQLGRCLCPSAGVRPQQCPAEPWPCVGQLICSDSKWRCFPLFPRGQPFLKTTWIYFQHSHWKWQRCFEMIELTGGIWLITFSWVARWSLTAVIQFYESCCHRAQRSCTVLCNNMHLGDKSFTYFIWVAPEIPTNTVPPDIYIFEGDFWIHLHIQ